MTAFTVPDLAHGEVDVEAALPDDQRFWSVTTLIGVLDKPALVSWAAKATATAAVNNRRTLETMTDDQGEQAAIDWLKRAPYWKKGTRTATELGTAVHDAIEAYTITGDKPEVDDEVRPFLNRFDEWAQRNSPVYQAAELAVFGTQYGYAGTCDAFLTIEGDALIADYKTTSNETDYQGKPTRPYPEVALQLAAYRHADIAAVWRARRHEVNRRRYYLLSPGERALAIPVPVVTGGVCIHITPTRCEAYAVRTDTVAFDAFLYCVEVGRWVFGPMNTAVGDIIGKVA